MPKVSELMSRNIGNTITNIKTWGSAIINVKEYGAKGDGETDDTSAIQRAIEACPDSGVLFFPNGTYIVTSTLYSNQSIHIFGYGATLKTMLNGMDNTFQFDDITDLTIHGVRFDQNMKGRTSINIINCSNFVIEDCYFTGYTAQYGHYKTDGGVRVTDSYNGKIVQCTWENHGNQYGAQTETLNRCVSLQGTTTDDVIVSNCNFYSVNQGIVVDCGQRNILTDNTFYDVKDNPIYILSGVKGMSVTGGAMSECADEGIVLSGENITISGVVFRDIPNRFIAITGGGVRGLTVTGNTFEVVNTAGLGDLFRKRSEVTDPISNIVFSNNIVKGKFGFAAVFMNGVTNFICENNIFDMTMTANNHIIRVDGASNHVSIRNNILKNSTSGVYGIRILGTAHTDSIVEGNLAIDNNARITIETSGVTVRNQSWLNSSGAYFSSRNSLFFGDNIPNRPFLAGDTVLNAAPTRVRNIHSWRCVSAGTPGTWQAYGTGWGTTAERPALTPNDAGYTYFDTTLAKVILWNGTTWQV